MYKRIATLFSLLVMFHFIEPIHAMTLDIRFEPPTYTLGALAGQDGWSGSGNIVSRTGTTRFGPEAQTRSLKIAPAVSRSVAGSHITDVTPFSFLWDWSAAFAGNSRFADFEIQADTGSGPIRIAKFGADQSGNWDTRVFAFGDVGGATTFFPLIEQGVSRPVLEVSGILNFTTHQYDIRFTNVTTGAIHVISGLDMLSHPSTTQAAASIAFTSISVEGSHYIDNLSFGGPAPTAFTWSATSGTWDNQRHWFPGTVPNTNSHTAIFGSAITVQQTVFTDSAVTVKAIQFGVTDDNGLSQSYAITGQGSVNLNSSTGVSTIAVIDGSHQFQTRVNLQNATSVNVASGATLAFDNALNLGGNLLTKTGSGRININNKLNAGGGTVAVTAGLLGGSGEVGGNLTNNGATVAPGSSIGTLSVEGNYTQASNSNLAIEISGPLDGEFDILDIAGSAVLDGVLDISLLSFTPSPNDSFSVLTAALGITNNGMTLAGDMADDFSLSLASNDTELVLTFQASGIPGDFDSDGDVDGRDFLVWQRGNTDPPLGQSDLSDWQANYGTPLSLATTAILPEPTSAGWQLMVVAAVSMFYRFRKRFIGESN